MKPFAKKLLSELNQQLQTIHTQEKNTIQQSKQAIKVIIEALQKLKSFTTSYKFKSQKEEIEFFKTIKPKFTAKLIYYTQIYHIETGNTNSAKKHYRKHLKKRHKWHRKNAQCCQYLKANHTYLDHLYFIRNNHEFRLTVNNNNLLSDANFTTAHDNTVAQYIANKAIKKYLKAKLKKRTKSQPTIQSPLTWTAPKTALIELLYALHAAQPFNNGNTSLNQIATTFETLFNIKLNQYHRTYYEICARKTIEPTQFLNSLKEKLTIRIFEADKN